MQKVVQSLVQARNLSAIFIQEKKLSRPNGSSVLRIGFLDAIILKNLTFLYILLSVRKPFRKATVVPLPWQLKEKIPFKRYHEKFY